MERRRRRPGVGQYIDPDTGEVRIIETSRHVKQQHRKSGTYYKQPTDKQLRQWDRQETLLNRAKTLKERESKRRVNAEKRTQREAREREAAEKQYTEGKITFTQTLARKDEDQLNLHKWFGGRPKQPLQPELVSVDHSALDESSSSNRKAYDSLETPLIMDINEEDLASFAKSDEEEASESGSSEVRSISKQHQLSAELKNEIRLSQSFDQISIGSLDDNFLTEPTSPHKSASVARKQDLALQGFKVPEIPPQSHRHPVTDQSNNRALSSESRNGGISNKCEPLQVQGTFTSHRISDAQDLLAGICTQDLYDIDFELDESSNFVSGSKIQPGLPAAQQSEWCPKNGSKSPPGHVDAATPTKTGCAIISPSKANNITSPADNRRRVLRSRKLENPIDEIFDDHTLLFEFPSQISSLSDLPQIEKQQEHIDNGSHTTDYDNGKTPNSDSNEEFGECSFSDNDLLQAATAFEANKPLNRCESYAMGDIDDNDMLEGLAEFEKSLATGNHKKKRTLPWELPAQDELANSLQIDKSDSLR